MPADNMNEPKPQTEYYHPEMVQLPELTLGRRIFRYLFQKLVRLVVWITIELSVSGKEELPESGPMFMLSNHLGDIDFLIGLVVSRKPFEVVAKIELSEIPFVRWILERYGVIWVHRGRPDRKVLREILRGLDEGRMVAIAPEARESLTGALEKGTSGAAYIALKACVPYLPVGFTGTDNQTIYRNLKRFRRSVVTANVGTPRSLDVSGDRRNAVEEGTEQIMLSIAALLPEEYRGVYRDA